jgi:nitroreductase
MDAIENLLISRRTIHSYAEAEVPENVLRQALEVALWAPNHRLTKPWKFIRLQGQARGALAEIAIQLKEKKGPLTEIKKNAIQKKYLYEGSLTIFAHARDPNPEVDLENYATVACGIQNFSLYLWDQGYGSKWSSGGIISADATYQLIGVSSDEFRIVGLLWAGTAVVTPKPQERGELSQYLTSIADRL